MSLIIDACTYKERDPWTMADWQPALEVCPHSSVIARRLWKVRITTITGIDASTEAYRKLLTCVIGIPPINSKLLPGSYRHNRWQWQLRISVGRNMTDR